MSSRPEVTPAEVKSSRPLPPDRPRVWLRWLRPAVSLALYGVILYLTDVRAIAGHLAAAAPGPVLAAILLYVAGQAMSAYKWRLLLGPVRLSASYMRLLAYYFTGMFFNLFLPTMIGGDAVKAVLLSRDTGAPARATMSVFMERNVGLAALLTIATVAAMLAPPIEVAGLSLVSISLLLLAGYVAVNLVIGTRSTYALVDRLIAASPLARWRGRTAPVYEALAAYRAAPGVVLVVTALSFGFQFIVVGVVFLNARALDLDVPVAALAVFVPLISLAGMIPLTVNGLGLREALYILLFAQVGIPTEAAVSLALLYLAVIFASSLPGGVVYALNRAPAFQTDAAVEEAAMRRS